MADQKLPGATPKPSSNPTAQFRDLLSVIVLWLLLLVVFAKTVKDIYEWAADDFPILHQLVNTALATVQGGEMDKPTPD